jgi:tetrahydromethanopterin S-methyltransferase subunit G
MVRKKKITIDDLAIMVQRGFEETARKNDVDLLRTDVDLLRAELGEFKKETRDNFIHVHARLGMIERDVKDVVHKDDFEDLMARVLYLEKKMGIVSGK